MLDFLSLIPQTYASSGADISTSSSGMTKEAIISVIGLVSLFTILVTEKIDKTIVSILMASALIMLQVFGATGPDPMSSQEIAGEFIYHNLDIFAFIIGMMLLSGMAKDSGIFNYVAISIAQKVKGSPIKLFFILAYMAFFMTIFISNIPTIIILSPIVVLIARKLEVPTIPYIIGIITFANLGGAVTPISDPTTYYQSTTLGLGFMEVVSNTGLIMFVTTLFSSAYLYLVFKKDLKTKPRVKELLKIKPIEYIENKKDLIVSLGLLVFAITIIIFKEAIATKTGIRLDNGTIALFFAFLVIFITKRNVSNILNSKVDYATLFFFAGLFIVVGALEHNGVIIMLADQLVNITGGSENLLLLVLTMGSALLSVFIDNVPYNIAMVSTLEAFRDNAIVTGTAWTALAWGLNSCTSIGGAGSPIGAACNVIALGQAEKTGVIIKFLKFLMIGVPLVIINSFVAYIILYFRYLG